MIFQFQTEMKFACLIRYKLFFLRRLRLNEMKRPNKWKNIGYREDAPKRNRKFNYVIEVEGLVGVITPLQGH